MGKVDYSMEKIYLIKEAAKLVKVEPHVLRYWEDELDMNIKRNEMGHRYYEEQDIKILQKVKELKDRGIQLKAIHDLVQKMYDILENGVPEEVPEDSEEDTYDFTSELVNTVTDMEKNNDGRVVDFKLAQFQNMMTKIVGNALKENVKPISQAVSAQASEDIVKQMDILLKEQEEREEERYHKLDAHLRELQLARKEIAAAEAPKNKKFRLGKKKK
jgi:DNA-binding transcriptional MerR regulator